MADENEELMPQPAEENQPEDASQGKEKKFSFIKVGIPVLLLQIVLAYFLADYVIVPKLYGGSGKEKAQQEKSQDQGNGSADEAAGSFGKIFTVEDVIVNPANSKGAQFVLINFGFEVKNDADVNFLKAREVQIRDILIQTISAKTIDQLDDAQDKEALRQEIKKAVAPLLADGHLLNVYFANYIIQ